MTDVPEIDMCAPRANERYNNAMQLMHIAHKMTEAGCLVDPVAIGRHKAAAALRQHTFTDKFLDVTKLPRSALGPAGVGTTAAVRDFFFETAHAPEVEFDKHTKRAQLNTAALTTYATAYKGREFAAPAAALIAIRKNRKILEFCHSYDMLSAHDGRIHFGFNVLGTVTGRWTSSTRLRVKLDDGTRKTYRVNAQQIPSKTPEFDFDDGLGRVPLVQSLRDIFVADPGCVLLKADYDQLELRLIAYVYAVKALITVIECGGDAHCFTASHLFKESGFDPNGTKPSKSDIASNPHLKAFAQAREAAKSCAYAMSYQMHNTDGDGRYPQLTKTLKATFPQIDERRVAALVKRFFKVFDEIRLGQLSVKERIDRFGFTELGIDGRRLYYPDTMRGYNQALNFPMQGTGGALVNRALLEVFPHLDWEASEQVRFQVHDELVVQAPFSRARHVADLIETAMSRKAQIGMSFIGIPAAADPGFNWGSTLSWKDFCKQHPGMLGP